jgi:hypothetical protein
MLGAYQSLGSAVKSMSVVPAELGVDTLQRRVPRGLRLLDTAKAIVRYSHSRVVDLDRGKRENIDAIPYPLR